MTRRTIFTLLAAAVFAAGCATKDPVAPPADVLEPDKYLFEHGKAELAKKHWLTSREYFRRLVDGYPQSPYRAEAKLGIGDSYLGEDSAEAQVYALNEFREFLSFFPTHPRADYAQYRMGMAYHQQMMSPQRDQTPTRDAIREFELFLERYPNSSLKPEVEAKLREAKDRLSSADLAVGLHYYRIKWFPGAIERFATILKRDPEFTNRDAVYFYMGEILSSKQLNRPAEALPYYDRIVKEFEKSEYLARAQKRIQELKR